MNKEIQRMAVPEFTIERDLTMKALVKFCIPDLDGIWMKHSREFCGARQREWWRYAVS